MPQRQRRIERVGRDDLPALDDHGEHGLVPDPRRGLFSALVVGLRPFDTLNGLARGLVFAAHPVRRLIDAVEVEVRNVHALEELTRGLAQRRAVGLVVTYREAVCDDDLAPPDGEAQRRDARLGEKQEPLPLVPLRDQQRPPVRQRVRGEVVERDEPSVVLHKAAPLQLRVPVFSLVCKTPRPVVEQRERIARTLDLARVARDGDGFHLHIAPFGRHFGELERTSHAGLVNPA